MRIARIDTNDVRRMALVTALAVVLTAVGVWATAQPSQAYCYNGSPYSGYVEDSLGQFAWEGPNYPSTCDGDAYYAGAVKDTKTDGYCVRAYFRDGGTTTYEGQSCSTSGTAFDYQDRTGNTSGLWCVGKGSSNWCTESPINPWAWSTASGY